MRTLIRSITHAAVAAGRRRSQFVPGHGPMSTFGAERRSNPFVSDAALGRMQLGRPGFRGPAAP